MTASDIKTINVDEFTTPCTHTLQPTNTIHEAEQIMKQHKIRHLPIIDTNKKILGIVSERDIFLSYKNKLTENTAIKEIMTPKPYCIPSRTKIYEAALTMSANKYGSAIVLYDDDSLGIFTSTDALNALIEIVRGDFNKTNSN